MSFMGSMMNAQSGAGFMPTNQNTQTMNAATNVAGVNSQQQDFLNALAAQGGAANQSSVFNQQQALANQMQGVAAGTGPNPAQAALNQATGANIASQGALMAGQRGSGANAGLMARQIAQQGANTQQQAVGQGATLQAQQQIAGMNALQGQQGAMAQNAQNMVANQANVGQNLAQNNLTNQGQLLSNLQANNANSTTIAAGNQQGQQNMMGGLMGAAGSMLMMADGGVVNSGVAKVDEPTSFVGKFMKPGSTGVPGMTKAPNDTRPLLTQGTQQFATGLGKGLSKLFAPSAPASNAGAMLSPKTGDQVQMANGGKVPVKVSPGEGYLPPHKAKAVAKGQLDPMKAAQKIPGKAKVKGDSLKNDTVNRNLEEGGVVIPRTVMESEDPAREAAAFVAAHLARSRFR